jgi:hypothetical protein
VAALNHIPNRDDVLVEDRLVLVDGGIAVETETKFMLGINTMTIARKAEGRIT